MLEREEAQYVNDMVFIDSAVRSIEMRQQYEFLAALLGAKTAAMG